MRLKLILFCALFLCAPNCYAKSSLYDVVVGVAIKTLAKIYVKTSNLKKLKAKYIHKIAHMKDDKFKKNYMKFYEVYKELPIDIKAKYVFTDKTTKDEVIERIASVKKKDLIAIINKIPSEFILHKTRHYTKKPGSSSQPQPQVNEMFLWRSIIEKV